MPFTEDIFAFTDRPNREHKYISGDEFASYWNDYDDENSFKLDPPNAVLTWVDADGVSEVEVVITDAILMVTMLFIRLKIPPLQPIKVLRM